MGALGGLDELFVIFKFKIILKVIINSEDCFWNNVPSLFYMFDFFSFFTTVSCPPRRTFPDHSTYGVTYLNTYTHTYRKHTCIYRHTNTQGHVHTHLIAKNNDSGHFSFVALIKISDYVVYFLSISATKI